MEQQEQAATTTIISALSTLPPPQLSDIIHSILSQTLHHHHRLASLLTSPSSFSLTLHHLQSLSLFSKTLLIANYLLSSLHHLTRHFHPPRPHPFPATLSHRDLDTSLLLLLLCDTHQQNPEILKTPRSKWREILTNRCYDVVLNQSMVGVHYGGVLLPYIDMITRCLKFVNGMGGCARKEGREVAAAPAAVVALPSVEVKGGCGGGGECGICKEDMKQGRDVCEMPCKHLFHWKCILPWLSKRNTCPYCRFQLPTQDVHGEIQRLWNLLVKKGGGIPTVDHT